MPAENSLRKSLGDGAVALGASAETGSPAIVETYGHVGLDFVWADFEHTGASPWDSGTIGNLVRAADTRDTALIVRLPEGNPPLVRKALDSGARNLVIPRVETADTVRQAVEAARFAYEGAVGDRGLGLGRANLWGATRTPQYPDDEDASVAVGAMIENESAVDNLDEILAVPDLGFAFVGPSDLSVSMGIDDPADDRLADVIATVAGRCREAGVPCGRPVAADPDAVRAAVDDGFEILMIGNEISAARQVFGGVLDGVGDLR